MAEVTTNFAEIQNINVLKSALTDAGYEYLSSGTQCSGAILSETWSHPEEGCYSFSYEYGSTVVADPEDY